MMNRGTQEEVFVTCFDVVCQYLRCEIAKTSGSPPPEVAPEILQSKNQNTILLQQC
jgi:hypothetical protein